MSLDSSESSAPISAGREKLIQEQDASKKRDNEEEKYKILVKPRLLYAMVDDRVEKIVSAFLRQYLPKSLVQPKTKWSSLKDNVLNFFIAALAMAGFNSVASITNRSSSIDKDELKRRIGSAFQLLELENKEVWPTMQITPSLIDAFIDSLEEKRTQTNLQPTLGRTISVRRSKGEKPTIPLIIDYETFLRQTLKDKTGPDVISTETISGRAGDVKKAIEVTVGLSSALAGALSGSFSKETTRSVETTVRQKVEYSISRRMTLEFPKVVLQYLLYFILTFCQTKASGNRAL